MDGTTRIEHDAAAWLARRDAGGLSAADEAAFAAWLDVDTAHRVAYLRLASAWAQADRLKVLAAGLAPGTLPERGRWSRGPFERPVDAQSLAAPGRAERRAGEYRARQRRARAFGAFAAAAVLALAGFVGWQRYDAVKPESYRTTVGTLKTLELADGSDATLSSDTAIDVALSRRERHIALRRGEAYFDVAKDASRPFAVEAGRQRIVAVGTRFSVRRDGDEVRVVVTEGTVRLESQPVDGNSQPVTLLPAGSVASANRNGVMVRAGSIEDAEQFVDWRRGYLVFRDTPLALAAAEFNRYNVKPIVIADSAAGTQRVGGSFRWSNADVFVNLVEQALPVKATREAERIVVTSR